MEIEPCYFQYRARSFLDIDRDWLKSHDFELMLLDADNTVLRKGALHPPTRIAQHLRVLSQFIMICMVSNRPYVGDLAIMCRDFGIRCVVPGLRYSRWKPSPWCLQEAIELHNVDVSDTVMVGDQLSDMIAATRAGCYGVLVDPLDAQKGYSWATRTYKLPKQERYLKALADAGRLPDYIPSVSSVLCER